MRASSFKAASFSRLGVFGSRAMASSSALTLIGPAACGSDELVAKAPLLLDVAGIDALGDV